MPNIIQYPTTMEEQIDDMTAQELSYSAIHSYCTIEDQVAESELNVPYASLINKYRHFLTSYVGEWELTPDIKRIFMYSPKAMSYHVYGTTELWSVLLDLNNCKSIMEFDLDKVKLYNPYTINTMINEILILEGVIR